MRALAGLADRHQTRTARERVRTAKALEKLPKTAEALGNGVLSYSKARSLTRVATAGSEAQLLELARAASAAKVEETVRVWRQLCRDGEVTAEQARHRSRKLSVFVDPDGMYVVAGRLEPEAGAVFKRALEAAAFALYKADGGEAGGTEPRQRRADAAGLVAERALETGLGGGDVGDDVADDAEASPAQSGSDAKSDTRSGARSKTRSGARAEHCQVVLHTEMATLREDGEPRTLGLGRRSRFRGNVPTHRLRRFSGADDPRAGRLRPKRRPQAAHHSAAPPPGAGGARPGLPLPGLRPPFHGRAPRQALGGRGRDPAGQPAAALPPAPPGCARGTGAPVH